MLFVVAVSDLDGGGVTPALEGLTLVAEAAAAAAAMRIVRRDIGGGGGRASSDSFGSER